MAETLTTIDLEKATCAPPSWRFEHLTGKELDASIEEEREKSDALQGWEDPVYKK